MSIKLEAIGVDGLPQQFIKLILPELLPALTHVLNHVIMTSSFSYGKPDSLFLSQKPVEPPNCQIFVPSVNCPSEAEDMVWFIKYQSFLGDRRQTVVKSDEMSQDITTDQGSPQDYLPSCSRASSMISVKLSDTVTFISTLMTYRFTL
jgi:hypothetical protein